ncbi:hypothetical protein FORMA_10390 [Formosa sp. Hel3_A1_48]|nr:hypothetical protein FORMA_10390 [Formosa sp. Hel3_A1_48]
MNKVESKISFFICNNLEESNSDVFFLANFQIKIQSIEI